MYKKPEKYQEKLNEAIKSLQIADHMTYVTFPLLNEQRLLLKIFDEIHKSIINFIEAILEYEYLYKRIQLYKDNNDNFSTFFERCAKTYSLTNEQAKQIKQIIETHKKHKQSSMEFVRKEKVVILSDNLGTESLDILKIKQYLLLAKQFLLKIRGKINIS